METKRIDTVEMIRAIRDKHARHLAGKSHAERIAFYRERAKKMSKKIPALLSKFAVADEYLTAEADIKSVREKRKTYKTKNKNDAS